MFLFLSKLLPLFLYPLGLMMLLLIGIWFWTWRQRSPVQWPALVALIILLLSSNTWVSSFLIQRLEYQYLPPEEIPRAPAIVVLGGGLYPADHPRQFPEVAEAGDRSIYAAQLYQEGKAPLIVASGGRIPWWGTAKTSEAADMAQLMQRLGVPKAAIIAEGDSLNTRQNAVNTQAILASRQIDTIILVTSGYHMPRSKRIFEKLGFTVIPAATDFLSVSPDSMDLNPATITLGLMPEASSLAQTTLALKEYLGLVIYQIRDWV
ncbi:MAG: hypothetical protein RLZZ568_464 [Cyanobacteriota bacterium]|jgi:uncharacterized SAM-binding protein YcdF (DUF218 family)